MPRVGSRRVAGPVRAQLEWAGPIVEGGQRHGSPARPLDVGIVGTGRVGAVLGAALARAGHRVVGASGVSAQSRRRAERLLPGVPLLAADQVVAAADLVLIAVPDDVLRDLVAGLASTGAWTEGQIVAHTSGAHGIGVLDPAAARGVVPLALHPAMTFAGRARGPRPARRRVVRGHRARGDAAGRRGAGRRARGRTDLGARAGPRALSRRADDRLELPDHAGEREHRPARRRRRRVARAAAGAACCRLRSTMRCGCAMRP